MQSFSLDAVGGVRAGTCCSLSHGTRLARNGEVLAGTCCTLGGQQLLTSVSFFRSEFLAEQIRGEA